MPLCQACVINKSGNPIIIKSYSYSDWFQWVSFQKYRLRNNEVRDVYANYANLYDRFCIHVFSSNSGAEGACLTTGHGIELINEKSYKLYLNPVRVEDVNNLRGGEGVDVEAVVAKNLHLEREKHKEEKREWEKKVAKASEVSKEVRRDRRVCQGWVVVLLRLFDCISDSIQFGFDV